MHDCVGEMVKEDGIEVIENNLKDKAKGQLLCFCQNSDSAVSFSS